MGQRTLSLLLLFAVSSAIVAQKLEITRYDVRDGLPQSQVTSLLEDEFGYIWLGTRGGGLSYFDGTKFRTYTRSEGLLSNLVLSIFKSDDGDLWIGGGRGVSRFNGTIFKTFDLGNRIQKVFQFYDTLYCFDLGWELTKIYQDSAFRPSAEQVGAATTVAVFSNNDTEYYTIDSSCKLLRHNKDGRTTVPLSDGMKVYSVVFPGGKTVIVTNYGAFRLESTNEITILEPRIKFPVVLVDDALEKVWLRHQTDLVSITFNGDEVKSDTLKIGANNFVGINDKEGITWIGTNGRGLVKYQPTEFKKIDGISDFVTSILKVGNKLWVGTREDGLFILENDIVKRKHVFNKKGKDRVNSLRLDNGGRRVWIATDVGLAYSDNSEKLNWYTEKQGLLSDSINDIEFDSRNRVWLTFKNGKGIGVLDNNKFSQYALNDSINPDKYYEMVYIPELDRMYVASDNSVVYIQDEVVERLAIPAFRKAAVYSIDRYKNDYLVIGSAAKGIALYNFRTDSVRHYARPDGPSIIYFTGTDNDDYVWLGNEMGVARLSFDDNLEVDEYLHFGRIQGHRNHEASFGSLYLGKSEKYFGLSDGLYRFIDPVQVYDHPLHFRSVSLFYGEEQFGMYADTAISFFNIPGSPELPTKKNHLTFSFLKVNKMNPEAAAYKYILEGFENKWSPPTRQNVVTYSNIPPGHYVFKVLARDQNGLWIKEPLSYNFRIKPPFYQTATFIVFCIALLLGCISLIVFFRVKYQVRKALSVERIRQEENAKLRKEIGRDFHDEMGNQLARIINYVGLSKMDGRDVSNTLSRVEESAKDLLSGTKDFTWALDPTNDCVSNLFVHAKDFGERFFKGSSIEFRATYNIKNDLKLPFGFGRQINLVLKEALTNAYKHSKAQWVDLTFRHEGDALAFEVTDNGVGVDKTVINSSDGGISNIVYRATKVGGDVSIGGYNGAGTAVILRIGTKQLMI